MSSINSDQDLEATFLSGVSAQGRIAATSYWTWNEDSPATYASRSYQAKWGSPHAGSGGTIDVAFDLASNWSTTEQSAFKAAMALWSAVANVTFNLVSSTQSAEVTISRATDGTAEGGVTLFDRGTVGSTLLGTALKGHIAIDTSVGGFGPIGSSFATAGGYPWSTILHELGHVIGLGHGGAYNEGTTTSSPMYTGYDSTAWSLMSYNNAPKVSSEYLWGTSGGYARVPVTPMPLDIVAAQRLYGAPVGGPLSGGQVFGFHTNIQGDVAQFFDFTLNSKPIVTLFDTGVGNTLDLSGFSVGSTVDLNDGAFSSVAGLRNNVAIAYGTRIDSAIGGTADDSIRGNANGDILMGGSGADTLTGGAGNDHIYGNMNSTAQGSVDGGDRIDAGDGSNYVNGNAGDDTITAGWGSNRLYGGGGNDVLRVTGGGTNHLNGNLGDDLLQVSAGTNDLHGGQGNDTIQASGGDNRIYGDLGNDVLWGGTGIDVMTGGPGADLFALSGQRNNVAASWDEITDFSPGTDKLHIDTSDGGLPALFHVNQNFADEASAAAYATSLFNGASSTEAAALQVGSDTYLFYTLSLGSSVSDTVVKLDAINAATISQADFVTTTAHL